jgi:PilZ domain
MLARTYQNGGTSMQEFRKARRYQLTEVVMLTWVRADGTVSQVRGVSQDISRNGISFIAAVEIEVGAEIRLDLYLRPVSRQSRGTELRADGVVLRVEPLGVVGSRIAAQVAFQEEHEEMFLASSAIQIQ